MRKRNVLFVVAAVLFLLVVLVEVGAGQLVTSHARDSETARVVGDADPSGFALSALALLDGMFLVGVIMMGVGSVSSSLHSRIHGLVTLISSIIVIIVAIILAIICIVLLTLMLALLFAPPFGTIIYTAVFGSFPRGAALSVLAILFALRVGGGVLLFLWQPRVLKAKGLLLLFFTCLGCGVLVSFVFGLVPGLLVSILDALAAIIICIVAAIWAIVLAIFGLISIVKSLT